MPIFRSGFDSHQEIGKPWLGGRGVDRERITQLSLAAATPPAAAAGRSPPSGLEYASLFQHAAPPRRQ